MLSFKEFGWKGVAIIAIVAIVAVAVWQSSAVKNFVSSARKKIESKI